MKELLQSPDPILSANIYASGLLDDLISKAIAPLRHELRKITSRCLDLWLIRYSRGGEHLKVRLHGNAGDAGTLRLMLTESVGRYFDSVQAIGPASPRVINAFAPPIDPEDEALAPPDRSMSWTSYRRSAVTLPWPWLEDDEFIQRDYECLARGCELVLAAFEASPAITASVRDRLLIKLSMDCLRVFGLCERNSAGDYLRYHRDWLLRFFLNGPDVQRRVLDHLTEEVKRRRSTIEEIAALLHAREAVKSIREQRWLVALAKLNAYTQSFRGNARYEVDEFASDVRFFPLFKLLHGLANQAGVPALQEAFVYHLLIAAIDADGGGGL